jgi:hypothetical protein
VVLLILELINRERITENQNYHEFVESPLEEIRQLFIGVILILVHQDFRLHHIYVVAT